MGNVQTQRLEHRLAGMRLEADRLTYENGRMLLQFINLKPPPTWRRSPNSNPWCRSILRGVASPMMINRTGFGQRPFCPWSFSVLSRPLSYLQLYCHAALEEPWSVKNRVRER